MAKETLKIYEARARIMKALAHPTRLFVVDRLAEHEHCVNELTAMVGCDMSTMSKHLAILKNAGVVADEKRGPCVYYVLRFPCVTRFFACTDNVLKTTAAERLVLA